MVPYCLLRFSVQYLGHTGPTTDYLAIISLFSDVNSSLNSHMDMDMEGYVLHQGVSKSCSVIVDGN